MFSIQFPKFNFRFRKDAEKQYIYDIIRKKYILITPEEIVRQHLIHYLIESKGFPKSLISIEMSLTYNQMQKRCDIVVFNRNAQPLMIIECKAPAINLSQKVFDQVSLYNLNLKVPYLVISNGENCYCSKIDLDKRKFTFLNEIPDYDHLTS